jgi:ketosteroid isomerase-like protein
MSAENLELLRRVYDRWGGGDFHPNPDFAEEFTITLGPDFPDAGTHRGRDGVAAYMKGFLEPWERLTISAEEMTDAGERALVRVLQSGTGSASGIAVELRYFHLWSFEDGRPTAMESIMREDDARARFVDGG